MTMARFLVYSCILHLMLLSVVFINLDEKKPASSLVNLAKKPGNGPTVIKATLVDPKVLQRAQELKAQMQKEKLEALAKIEAEKAKALELANKAKLQAIQQKAQAKKLQDEKLAQKKLAEQKAKQIAGLQQRIAQSKILADKKQATQIGNALASNKDVINTQNSSMYEAEVAKYTTEFREAIIANRIISSVFDPNLKCQIRIKLLPDGSISAVTIEKSSGNRAYDEISQNAVYKAAPFPMPQDPKLYSKLRDVVLSFRNDEGDNNAQ